MSLNAQSLEYLKTTIESMNKQQHIEIANILKNNPSVKMSENKSGIYVNLSFLPESSIKQMVEHVDYIKDQENSLSGLETQKMKYKNMFFPNE